MRINRAGFGLLAGMVALGLSAVPASAEFFGCRDKPGQLLYSYSGSPGGYHSRSSGSSASYSSGRTTSDYSAHTRYYRAGSAHATYYDSGRYREDRSWR